MDSVPTLDARLQFYRTCDPNELVLLISTVIPNDRLPKGFLDALNDEDRTICHRACMICWSVTNSACVPWEMQLRVILAERHGFDALVASGTGSGKTLPMALTMLLDDPAAHRITITISPLKRLQLSQESDFNRRYGIRTVVINEETKNENSWWEENVHHIATRTPGTAQHLIVTVEQLFKRPEGHLPRLAMLIRQNQFSRRIARINIDEVHCIHMAGLSQYGLPAFRPAWGKLNTLKLLLSGKVPWLGFSATIPPHILKTVKSHILCPNYVSIHYSSNRENTMYATHAAIGSIEELRNYECFLASPFSLENQPHVLIFVDDKDLTDRITSHLDSHLPDQYRNQGIVRHYHGAISKEYLMQVHDSFVKKDGACRILVATSGESVGIDFPNVKVVCMAGLPSTIVDALQRGGRAIHIVSVDPALFVVFYDPWALEINEDEYTYGSPDDPDRPRKEQKPTSPCRERAPLSSLQLVQTPDCLRAFYANYLADNAPEALCYTTLFCCDRHGDGFILQKYLPGRLYTEEYTTTSTAKERRKYPSYRPTAQRPALDDLLIEWLKTQHANDTLGIFHAEYDILSFEHRELLGRTHMKHITSSADIVRILDKTEEWGEEWAEMLYDLICNYQRSLSTR